MISATDKRALGQADALLRRAGISLDAHLDFTAGLFDENGEMLATGSVFGPTLRCLAVAGEYRGMSLLNQVVSFLLEREVERGFSQAFLYTKCDTARFFTELGFYEIERVPDRLVFMTNRPRAFANYLGALQRNAAIPGVTSAVVMNANPFTLGHLHLLERASFESDVVHCFVVSEDASLVPYADRIRLVREGSAHLGKVMVHPSGEYMISNATFPSYFLKDDETVTRTHAQLDIRIFSHIAKALGITKRFAGEEPYSGLTRIYNEEMARLLPEYGVQFIQIPRATAYQQVVSASVVRRMIHDGNTEDIRRFVPYTTYQYFQSEAGRTVAERIRRTERVEHD